MLRYRLKFEPDDNGTVLVTSPDFPLVTFGDDEASAHRQAVDAIHSLLASMIDAPEDIPSMSSAASDHADGAGTMIARLPLQTTLKVELYRAMRAVALTRGDLQWRLGWQRESVDRLFRPDHNSRIEQIDEAFRALGKEDTVNVLDRAGRIAA